MKRLKLIIWIIFLSLSVPMGYFIVQTYRGLKGEETARLRFFADTIFDEIENELMQIVHAEESRLVDEYNPIDLPDGADQAAGSPQPSPLSQESSIPYVLGYFQNNPDGSFHTPLLKETRPTSPELVSIVDELKSINAAFNARRTASLETARRPKAAPVEQKTLKGEPSFEDPYWDRTRKKAVAALPQQRQSRIEEITAGQAMRLSQKSTATVESDGMGAPGPGEVPDSAYEKEQAIVVREPAAADTRAVAGSEGVVPGRTFQAEIAPLQSVLVSDDRVFMFRRVVIAEKIYRQGFVIKLKALAEHLAATHFSGHPIAGYARMRIEAAGPNGMIPVIESGVTVADPAFSLRRTFPFPFDFLSAGLDCRTVPHAANRRFLNVMVAVLISVFALGFMAIYHSARTVIDLSERRSRFVASVTHELKTPLTNIRMYIELLEQGIAGSPEREQEYFGVLNAESVRLSRLISNVLELSRLENRQRRIDLRQGHLDEVLDEIETVLGPKLRRAGFTLHIDRRHVRPFQYDADIMMLILTNLIENSLKFGANRPVKQITIQTRQRGAITEVSVADSGPGIPRHALKKVFQDFYRVKGDLTETTGGTGIGLALVKKSARLMNGTVTARNNDGPGCTITVSLPTGAAG